jgi:hypothetical protein
MKRTAILASVLMLGAAPASGPYRLDYSAAGPASLSVRVDDQWVEWWRSDRAPERWAASDSRVLSGITWHARGEALEWGELQLSGTGEAWRLKAIVVRLDPARFRFRLATALSHSATEPEWTVDSAGDKAQLAFNAGQFAGAAPWGWVVHQGREVRPRGRGPLAQTVFFDSLGGISFLDDSATVAAQAGGPILEAFQTYPSLLVDDGVIPAAFGAPHPLLDVEHRDSRLAIGLTREGRLLVVLTRFDGLGGQLDGVPFGLTVAETAALMGALGCRTAAALDGGISGQLLVRSGDSTAVWHGWRKVPLGLIAEPRP